ncbi:MAG TPA: ABC transporter substrate-binding protein [Methanobacterium sp.]|nr:ABC transporter substrate-binding protein [Methanobacterium sp.]
MGYLSTIYHTSFILKNKPLGNLNNYDLKWSLFATGPAMKDAFASGDLDVGYIGLPPVMIGIENGLKIKCVGGGHVEGTVMVAPESYKTFDELGSVNAVLKQFEGKIIGTPSKGCIHDVIIREMTKNFDIEIKNFSWADFIPDGIEEGEIAAGVGTPSLATVTSRRFASNVVIPPHNLWPYNPSYGIVVKEELIDESPEFITDFLKAHEDACNLVRLHPEQAAEIALKEIRVFDKDFVRDTYKISPKYCASIPDEYIESTLKFIPVLQRLGYMKGNLKQKNIFNLEFIREVHPEPAHY